MQVKNIIFHKIISEQYESQVNIIKRESVVTPDQNAHDLLAALLKSYQKDSHLAYAGFDETEWFPNQLRELIDGAIPFYEFSIQSAEKIKQHMMRVATATGGFLTFIKYHENSDKFFMVILIKNRKGIGITNNLQLETVQSLELDKLHFAAKIDINRWNSTDEQEKRNHVSFLKGRTRKDEVVNYFKAFLGIDEDIYIDPTRHTDDLVNSVINYVIESVPQDQKNTSIDRVHAYAMDCKDSNIEVTLKNVASLVSPSDPEQFFQHVVDEKKEIPPSFTPTERELKNLVKFRIKGSNYYLSFNQEAINKQEIELFNDKDLIIRNIPKSIVDRL